MTGLAKIEATGLVSFPFPLALEDEAVDLEGADLDVDEEDGLTSGLTSSDFGFEVDFVGGEKRAARPSEVLDFLAGGELSVCISKYLQLDLRTYL